MGLARAGRREALSGPLGGAAGAGRRAAGRRGTGGALHRAGRGRRQRSWSVNVPPRSAVATSSAGGVKRSP